MASAQTSVNRIQYVPMQQVFYSQVHLPGVKQADLRQAIPYAIEDQLLQPIESLQFAYCAIPDKSGAYAVAVTQLPIGVSAAAIVPQFLQIPFKAQAWSVMSSEDYITIRYNEWETQCVECWNVDLLFDTKRPLPLELHCYGDVPKTLIALCEKHQITVSHYDRYDLLNHDPDTVPLNFTPTAWWQKISSPLWRRVAMYFLGGVIITLLLRGVEYHYFTVTHQVMMRRSPDHFLQTMSMMGQAITPEDHVRLQNLSYQKNVLTATIEYPNATVQATVLEKWRRLHLGVKVLSSTQPSTVQLWKK